MPTKQLKRKGWRWWVSYAGLIPSGMCLPMAILSGVLARCAAGLCFDCYGRFLQRFPELHHVFSPSTPPFAWTLLAAACAVCAMFCLIASLGGFIRTRFGLALIRRACASAYVLFGIYAYAVLNVTGQIQSGGIEALGGVPVHAVQIFYWRYTWLWFPTCILIFVIWLHAVTWRRATINAYSPAQDDTPAPGDRFLENVRTNGRDPRYRKSSLTSVLTHLLLIVILPWLLRLGGCIDPYRPPWGGGQPKVTTVQVVKKKPQKKKKFILNPNSKIILHAPELDDSDLKDHVEDESRLTYASDPNALFGQLGDGDAKTPGWQDGFKDGIVRFIRLEYQGEHWDDGMDEVSAADRNFLQAFKKMSGGMRTAAASESHPIRLLKKYPKGQAPPFVYMTGSGNLHVPEGDVKVLREFLQDGSLLFADAGSGQWDRSFRTLMRRVFPGHPLIPIPDDDPIFQMPFAFANGAPPLWHHGGDRVMGVKLKNRWAVFYHPGDINDAWKTGHSGMESDLARKAHEIGVNVVYYSFMRYFEETRKYRK